MSTVYRTAKKASGLTNNQIVAELADAFPGHRGISLESASLWSRGLALPPRWTWAVLARVLGVRNFSGFSLGRARARR